MEAGARVTGSELDEALARAIRQLIADAIEAGIEAETGPGAAAAPPA